MDIRKFFNNTAIILICLAAASLLLLNIYQHRQIQKIVQKKSAIFPNNDEVTAALTLPPASASQQIYIQPQNVSGDNVNTGDNEVDNLVYQIGAAEEELSMVQEQIAADETKKAERKRLERELQKKYMENPAFEADMKNSLEQQYADLFDKLNLSPEDTEKFKEILFQENMAQQALFMEYDDISNLPQEQRDEFDKHYQEINEEFTSQKETLLGENNYETYQSYTETEYERYNVNNFNEFLDADEELTDTQKEALIESIHEERQYIVYENIDADGEATSNMYDEKNIEVMLANQDKQYDAYRKAAAGILSASQMETLKDFIEKERDQYKIILEMSALRYASSADQNSTDQEDE